MFILRFLTRLALKIVFVGFILGLTASVVVMREWKTIAWFVGIAVVVFVLRTMLRSSSDRDLLDAQLRGQIDRERDAAALVEQPVAAIPLEALPPVVVPMTAEPEVEDLAPGVLGARIAFAESDMQLPEGMLAVSFLGRLCAYATWDSYEPVGDFAEVARNEPEYQVVGWMVMYAQAILAGDIAATYRDADALSYALKKLIPAEILERKITDPHSTAEGLNVPVEVLSDTMLAPLRSELAAREANQPNHDPASL